MRGEIFIASIVGLAAAVTTISLAHTPQAAPAPSQAAISETSNTATAATITVTVPLADRVVQLEVPAEKVHDQDELAQTTAALISEKLNQPGSANVVDVILQTSELTPVKRTEDLEG